MAAAAPFIAPVAQVQAAAPVAEARDGKLRGGHAGHRGGARVGADNIADLGGAPGNVTIFWQSGGGSKVCNLMGMPAAKGVRSPTARCSR